MFVTPTLSISCITCMQQGDEGGNNKGHESPGKIRLDGFVPETLYGGTGGLFWDDRRHHGVTEITVASDSWIDSIRVAYDKDGELVNDAEKHGGPGGIVHSPMTLGYPDEFLVSVSGSYFYPSALGGNLAVIESLEFRTNRGTLKQYGPRKIEGMPFSLNLNPGDKIVGMMGRSGVYLDAIGFHIARPPKRKLFLRVKESLKKLWPSRVYDTLIEITRPLSIVQCTGISM
ncbi:hypothetical protein M0R45_031951 [Rubus argutus]|uniref:Jacalin-type lectin domain-containing protein n=1 Tax=Rubus argutus TaxID=59490 RepID=A0AAW1WI31_RUBAR